MSTPSITPPSSFSPIRSFSTSTPSITPSTSLSPILSLLAEITTSSPESSPSHSKATLMKRKAGDDLAVEDLTSQLLHTVTVHKVRRVAMIAGGRKVSEDEVFMPPLDLDPTVKAK